MVVKIGINGFGRIGRMLLRVAVERHDIEVVAINDPFIPPDYMVYQFKFDSTHGTFKGQISTDGKKLIINKKEILVTQEKEPSKIPWADAGAVYVAECSGVFLELNDANAHFKGGAKRVCISAPSKTAPMYVVGVNDDKLKKRRYNIFKCKLYN